MKKNKLWSICNLAMAVLLVLSVLFAVFYDLHTYAESVSGEDFSGLGVAVMLLLIIYAGVFDGVSFILLTVSWIGLLKTDKTRFLVVGIIGKILSLGGWFFLFIVGVNLFTQILYCIFALCYLTGAILDIVFRKKLKE